MFRPAVAFISVMAVITLAACGTNQSAVSPTVTATPTEELLATPDPYSTVEALPELFPTDLLVVPPGAEILLSSARPLADGRWEVSLNLRSEQDLDGLVAAIGTPLETAGFASDVGQAAQGLVYQAVFTRAEGEILMVAIRDEDGIRTVTTGGVVVWTPSES